MSKRIVLFLTCIFVFPLFGMKGGTEKSSSKVTSDQAAAITNNLLKILRSAENLNYGESISQLEHALQCAKFARDSRADDETIAAALLHDIGHLLPGEKMGEIGIKNHEGVGATYLFNLGFPPKTVALVALHVQAKRYQVSKKPEYWNTLSAASKKTLIEQGGAMKRKDAKLFENDPVFTQALKLRNWDDRAKVVGMKVYPLKSYRPIIKNLLLQAALSKEVTSEISI